MNLIRTARRRATAVCHFTLLGLLCPGTALAATAGPSADAVWTRSAETGSWQGGEGVSARVVAGLGASGGFTLRVRATLEVANEDLFTAELGPTEPVLRLRLHDLGPGVLVFSLGTGQGTFVVGAPLVAADREGAKGRARDLVVRQGTAGLELFVDGVRRAARPIETPPLAPKTGARILIGSRGGDAEPLRQLNRAVSSVELWSRPLSDQTLQALAGGVRRVSQLERRVQRQLGQARAASPRFHRQRLRLAEASVAAAKKLVADDTRRPIYHFQAPAQWMNDPNGPLYFEGDYHLFYQFNPYGSKWGHMHWGHARSRDLVHWEHMPIALSPSHDVGEEHCFSGSAVVHRGVPTIFYTSIGPANTIMDGATQWMAQSRDGMRTWQKFPGNPVVTHDVNDGRPIRDARDPFVWQEGGAWYMVVGGHAEGGKGALFQYRATDLVKADWTFVNVLHEGGDNNWECPNFFALGDKRVLVFSPHRPHDRVQYFVGDLDPRRKFQPTSKAVLDHTRTFFAPNSLVDGAGRRISWGWARIAGKGWSGMLTVPRVLTLRPDGRLAQAPAPELMALRAEPRGFRDVPLQPRGATAGEVSASGEALDVELVVAPGGASEVGLEAHRSDRPGAEPIVRFVPDKESLEVAGQQIPFQLLPDEPNLEVRLLVDRSIVEVFVNAREVFTVAIDGEAPRVDGLRPYARGVGARVVRFDTWRMNAAAGPTARARPQSRR